MTGEQDPRRWIALGVLCLSVLLISLDQTILNVALPTLIGDLHPGTGSLPWIADGYTLTNGVLILFAAALGDRYGRRRIFLLGAAIFGAGSLACALSHDTDAVIAARTIMGLGAALLTPATLSIITATFSGGERAKAIGLWAGVGGIGAAAGPLLGGFLLQHFWWGSVFLINVPVAAITVVAGILVIEESRAPRRPRLDLPGVALSATGLGAITYGLITGPDDGWGSARVAGSLAGGAVLVAACVLWERRCAEPLIDMRLFRDRAFSSALGAVTAVFFAMFGVSYLLGQFIQFVQGASAFGVGLRFLPLALALLAGAALAASFAPRHSLRAVMVAGMATGTGGLAVLALVPPGSGIMLLEVPLALIGLGIGTVIAPASNAVMSSLPPDAIGAGSGLRSMVQLLGGSFGVAVLGSIATSRYRSEVHHAFHTTLAPLPPPARGPVASQIGQAIPVVKQLPPALAQITDFTVKHAFASGLHLAALAGAAFLVAAAITAAILVPHQSTAPAKGTDQPHPAKPSTDHA